MYLVEFGISWGLLLKQVKKPLLQEKKENKYPVCKQLGRGKARQGHNAYTI